jgi:hypothetical protein
VVVGDSVLAGVVVGVGLSVVTRGVVEVGVVGVGLGAAVWVTAVAVVGSGLRVPSKYESQICHRYALTCLDRNIPVIVGVKSICMAVE